MRKYSLGIILLSTLFVAQGFARFRFGALAGGNFSTFSAGFTRSVDIGSTRPVLSTSMGRALLLAAPAAERAAVLNRLKIEDPERYAIERPLLDADEANFRERGYCISRGDWRREVHAMSVPLRHHDDGLALNCTMSAFRLRRNFLEKEVAPQLLEAVLRIEQASGFH